MEHTIRTDADEAHQGNEDETEQGIWAPEGAGIDPATAAVDAYGAVWTNTGFRTRAGECVFDPDATW